MNNARSSFSACYLNNKIYVCGGFKANNKNLSDQALTENKREILNSCEVYNIEKEGFVEIPKMNEAVAGASLCAF
jgi:hypothetical protein